MQLKDPIEIDLLDFFKTGKFDYIKLGQTKEWILNNFPYPDDFDDKFNIWTYGNIEFHFDKDKLFLIYSDSWYYGGKLEIDSGSSLKLKKWIFNYISKLNLRFVLEALNTHNIDYKKKTDNLGVILRLNSGIELTFENTEYQENLDANYYELTSFGLIEEESCRWK